MGVRLRVFSGSDVLRVTPESPKSAAPFLKWKIDVLAVHPREDVLGVGLYAICYGERLAYVGAFCPASDPFKKNIVKVMAKPRVAIAKYLVADERSIDGYDGVIADALGISVDQFRNRVRRRRFG